MALNSEVHTINSALVRKRIKEILRDQINGYVGLRMPLEEIGDSTDLYRAGLTSHASVVLMVALENEFEIEFPDGMLSRDVFESIDSIATAIESVTAQQ